MEWLKPDILLDSMSVVGVEFCEIINQSLNEGIFPNWKCSTICPIEKVNGTLKIDEFRPINTLPSYEKVLEIIVKIQFDDYIDKNKIMAEQQSGFRKNHCCETALNRVIDDWKDELELDKIIICIFLDLKRAFETIAREILLTELEQIGVRGVEKSWFDSYLTNRLQQTKIGSCISSQITNEIGVPREQY